MTAWRNPQHRAWSLALAVGIVLGMAVWSGCSEDDDIPGAGDANSTSFRGVFSNGGENGTLNVTVQTKTLAPKSPIRRESPLRPAASAVVTASGVMRFAGAGSMNLIGTYDNQTDSLVLSGGSYTFVGEHDTTGVYDAISGRYSGPTGPGFFACLTGLVGASTYCGAFASGSTPLSGSWDLLTAGSVVRGVSFPTGGDPIAFAGTIQTTGTTRAITAGASESGVFTLTVTGSLNVSTNTVSGTWSYDDLVGTADDSGTWTGSLCP